MQHKCLPQVWPPQQVVLTSTVLELHVGVTGGLWTHTSVWVWLSHVHRWHSDCHTSPGWRTELKWVFFKHDLNCGYYCFCRNETNLFTSLGSPSGPLQSDGWKVEIQTNTTITIQHLLSISYTLSLLSLHFTHRDIQKRRYLSDFQS